MVTNDMVGLLVDSEIVLSTRYGKTRVFINKNLQNPYQRRPLINKTLSTETSYQQGLIVGKLGPGMRCCKFNSTSNVLPRCVRHKGKCMCMGASVSE